MQWNDIIVLVSYHLIIKFVLAINFHVSLGHQKITVVIINIAALCLMNYLQ